MFTLFGRIIPFRVHLGSTVKGRLIAPFRCFNIAANSRANSGMTTSPCTLTREVTRRSSGCKFSNPHLGYLIFYSHVSRTRTITRQLYTLKHGTLYLSNTSASRRHRHTIDHLRQSRSNNSTLRFVIAISVFGRNISVPAIGRIVLTHPASSTVIFIRRLKHNLHVSRRGRFIAIVSFINGCGSGCGVPITLCKSHSLRHRGLHQLITSNNGAVIKPAIVRFSRVSHRHILEDIGGTGLGSITSLNHTCHGLHVEVNRVPALTGFTRLTRISPELIFRGDGFNYCRSLLRHCRGGCAVQLTPRRIVCLQFISRGLTSKGHTTRLLMLQRLVQKSTALPRYIRVLQSFSEIYNRSIYTIRACRHRTEDSIQVLSLRFFGTSAHDGLGPTYRPLCNSFVKHSPKFITTLRSHRFIHRLGSMVRCKLNLCGSRCSINRSRSRQLYQNGHCSQTSTYHLLY